MGDDVVVDRAGLNDTRPAHDQWDAEPAFPGRALLTEEGRRSAVRPSEFFRAVVGGVDDNGIVSDAEVVELFQHLADRLVVLDHAIGIEANSGLSFRLLLEMGPDVHACRVEPKEEWFFIFDRSINEFYRRVVNFLIDGRHPLGRQRPGVFNLLRTIRVGPRMDHAAWTVFLPELWIFRIVVALRLLFGIEVVEVAKELIEAVIGGQMLVAIAEVVLAKLAACIAKRLEQFGDGGLVLGDALW